MKLLIIGVCMYLTAPPFYKYYCYHNKKVIEVYSNEYLCAGDTINVPLNYLNE